MVVVQEDRPMGRASWELFQDCWLVWWPGDYNGAPSTMEPGVPYQIKVFPNLYPHCPVGALPEPLLSAVLHAIGRMGVPAACALTDAIGRP